MDGGVGHTTWAPEGREGRSQAGPKVQKPARSTNLEYLIWSTLKVWYINVVYKYMTIWRLPVFGPTEWIIRIGFVLVGINPTYERVSLLSNLLIVVYRTKVGAKICVCYKSQLVGKNSTDIRIALLGDWPPMVDWIRDRILHVDNSQVHSSVHSCYFMYHVSAHNCAAQI